MKKLSLKPEELLVESFGTLAHPRERGTVRGAADTLDETCACLDTYCECPDTYFDCPDTLNPSCPRTCGIMYGAGDNAIACDSCNCPCM